VSGQPKQDSPQGWVEVLVNDLFSKIVDGSHNPPAGQEHGIAMLSARNVSNDLIEFSDFRWISSDDFEREDSRTQIRDDDVLLTIVGTIGRAAVVHSHPPFALQRSVAVLRPVETSSRFCMYQFQAPSFQRQLREAARGTAQKGVYLKMLSNLTLGLAPRHEQDRIVAEIEKQFTRLDAAVAALERVQANLKRYRAAVLTAACEGRLVPTEAELARKEGRSYETGERLLARILKERRAKWEADQLAKVVAADKPLSSDDWKKKYKEPEPPDTHSLSALPEGWSWALFDGLAEIKGGVTKGQQRRATDVLLSVPYLRVANVQRGYLDLQEIKEILATKAEIIELQLQSGDILLNEGGDRDKLGRGWIWDSQIPQCIHQNHVFRARLHSADFQPRFISWYANSFGQVYFFDEGKQTTNLASINMTKLKALPVPIPPAAEQLRIVQEVERQLSDTDETLRAVGTALRHADRLRQSILKRAFEGKLVPRDPDDESASALLEHIRAERASRSLAQEKKLGRKLERRRPVLSGVP
jgi:type I restriction enzyme, S subunit